MPANPCQYSDGCNNEATATLHKNIAPLERGFNRDVINYNTYKLCSNHYSFLLGQDKENQRRQMENNRGLMRIAIEEGKNTAKITVNYGHYPLTRPNNSSLNNNYLNQYH